jgi:hypothetical protein
MGWHQKHRSYHDEESDYFSEDNNEEEYGICDWSDEDMQRIINWLGMDDVDPPTFRNLVPDLATLHTSIEIDDCEYSNPLDRRAWNGQIVADLERILRLFLNSEDDWIKEMEFVANRIRIKSILINRVKVCQLEISIY